MPNDLFVDTTNVSLIDGHEHVLVMSIAIVPGECETINLFLPVFQEGGTLEELRMRAHKHIDNLIDAATQ